MFYIYDRSLIRPQNDLSRLKLPRLEKFESDHVDSEVVAVEEALLHSHDLAKHLLLALTL